MRRVLQGFRVEQPASLSQLAHAVRCSSFDLVLVSADFDGSRAIEALKTARWHAPRVPLVCVRAAPFPHPLGAATLAAFQAALEELDVDCFVDMMQFADDDGGNARVRGLLERLAFDVPAIRGAF